jgi:hypothetical protein
MRIRGSSALAAGVFLAFPLAVQGAGVVCDGAGLTIENGLFGVSGATLQDRIEIAAGA